MIQQILQVVMVVLEEELQTPIVALMLVLVFQVKDMLVDLQMIVYLILVLEVEELVQ